MTRRFEAEDDLRDPALTALLRNVYTNDPALAEAPGRTERIMRLVLSEGVRPVRRPSVWAPFAWACASVATAAAALTLILALATPGGMTGVLAYFRPAPANIVAPDSTTPRVIAAHPDRSVPTPIAIHNTLDEQPLSVWQMENSAAPALQKPAPQEPAKEQPTVIEHPTFVAATLYSAGKAAQAVGDTETAYEAYKASYETVPTPDALLASGDALYKMAQESLDSEG